MTKPDREAEDDHLAKAARRTQERQDAAQRDPEPTLARRFGQIGVLGWVIVGPTILGMFVGNRLDAWLGTGVMLVAALTMLGAGLGLWLALRWMHDQ